MEFVTVKGATLATQSFGTPDKGTILLIMGANASMLWWPESLCRALAAGGYRTIRFDLRDTGESTTGAPGAVHYDIGDLADDIIAIFDHYGVAAAHLAGMSLGGYLAQIVALTHPGRVASLTLIASEPLGRTYQGEGIAPEFMDHFGKMATLDWSDEDAVAGFLVTIAELCAGSAFPFDRADAMARIRAEIARSPNMAASFNHAQLQGKIDPALKIDDVSQPVLVIHGTKDPIIAFAAGQAIVEATGAEMLALEGRGHELAPLDLGVIGEKVLEFLAGVR